jgi:Rrf2 family protein
MQFSKSTGYALHALIHLARAERGQYVGIKELASLLGVPTSYLSKIMSKLRQDGIIRAVTGLSGGYELARPAEDVTFLDVVQVIEGRQHLYDCYTMNAEEHKLFNDRAADEHWGKECLVKKVMLGAECEMFRYLKQHTIKGVLDAASFHLNNNEVAGGRS